MKTRSLIVVGSAVAALALSGCDQIKKLAGGGGAPAGQVVATVDGEEITTLQLRSEMGGFGSRDPEVMKAAQQQALQRIILRKLLAQEAREQKLDKGADYTIQVERGQETLLAQLYQRKLAAGIKQPTRAEAESYITNNPNRFANRKVLFVDQIIAAPNKIDPERLRPLKTFGEVKALLDAEGVQYQENAVTLDTLSANPRLVEGVTNLPPGEIFVIPQGGSMVFNQVAASRPVPFRGDTAIAYATNQLRSERAREIVSKKVESLRKAAEPEITYNPAYKPADKKAAPAKAPDAKAPAASGADAPAAGAPATPEPAAK
ncbi:MAG: hypothetical protein ACOY5Y_12355 [Pseudomonadota bacterium]